MKKITPQQRQTQLERLEHKLQGLNARSDAAMNDSRFRNLCFCSAGNLSKGSSNYRLRHRDKIGNLLDEVSLCKRAIKIVKGEPFTLNDIHECQREICRCYPEYTSYIGPVCGILFAADAVRLSFRNKHKAVLNRYPVIIDFNTGNSCVYSIYRDNQIITLSQHPDDNRP